MHSFDACDVKSTENKKCLRNINAPHGAKFKMAIPVKGIMKLVLYTRQN